jgi:hypothetical protein
MIRHAVEDLGCGLSPATQLANQVLRIHRSASFTMRHRRFSRRADQRSTGNGRSLLASSHFEILRPLLPEPNDHQWVDHPVAIGHINMRQIFSGRFDFWFGNFWLLNIAGIHDGDRPTARATAARVSPLPSKDNAGAFKILGGEKGSG